MQFPIPDIKGATVKILSRPNKGEISFDVEDCFKKGQQLFCKVMKWRSAPEAEGVALRVQLMSEDKEGEESKMKEMVALHSRLMKEYGVDGEIAVSLNDKEISERLSRHRSSLSKKYNLNANEML